MHPIRNLLKKFCKFIFVRRIETRNKWWHRLFLVLIYGSTIVGGIFLGILMIYEEKEYWFDTTYTAYSFESRYQTANGAEIDCKFSAHKNGNLPFTIFRCGDFISNNSDFLDKYNNALDNKQSLDDIRQERSFSDLSEIEPGHNFSSERVRVRAQEQTEGRRSIEDVDAMLMVELIESGALDAVKVKSIFSFDYALFFGNLGIFLLLIFGWLVFWESIIYRTILFIAYGKEEKSSV